ncbi:hypothetical protein H5410_005367 [Solanum commersonii]|uniref:Uncharacterized protein n=1 Tax=Solanum commersonii TaxID=4109 RepID=A0A9J6A6G2_SOLCO|nr:hypothetical protein H5410_005367 [Solanum commersonii]
MMPAIFEGDSDFTWDASADTSGVEENYYGLRGDTSSLHRRGKSSFKSLVDEVEEDNDGVEEDDEQYNDSGGKQDCQNHVTEGGNGFCGGQDVESKVEMVQACDEKMHGCLSTEV